jgi:hypothetical protein
VGAYPSAATGFGATDTLSKRGTGQGRGSHERNHLPHHCPPTDSAAARPVPTGPRNGPAHFQAPVENGSPFLAENHRSDNHTQAGAATTTRARGTGPRIRRAEARLTS